MLCGREVLLDEVQDLAGEGVLVRGAAGMGLSAFMRAVEARLSADGHDMVRIVGTRALGSVPLGAVAHLLPPDSPGSDHLEMLLAARTAVADVESPAVLVDDGHLLDELSASLVVQLANTGVPVVAGSHAVSPVHPEDGSDVLEAGLRRTVVLPPLSEDAINELATALLGAPISPSLLRHLTHLSQGLPGFIVTMLSTSQEEGLIAPSPLGLTHTGSLAASRGTARIASALSSIAPETRELLTALSLAEVDLPTHIAETLWPRGLADARWFGLTAESTEGSVPLIRGVYPVLGEVLRRGRSHGHLHQLVADVLGAWPDVAAETLRRAEWILEAGAEVPAAELTALADAVLTRGETILAERLAEQAMRSGGGDEARLLRARSRLALAPSPVLEAELADLASRSSLVAPAAAVHLAHLLNIDGRSDDAAEVLVGAMNTACNGADLAPLQAQLALIRWSSGERREAEAIADALLACDDADTASTTTAVFIATSRAATAGRPDEAAALADGVDPSHIMGSFAWQTAAVALTTSGRIDEARTRCERLRTAGAPPALVYSTEAWIALQTGDFAAAADLFRDACERLPFGASPLVVAASTALRAYSLARIGETEASRAALHDLRDFPTRARMTTAGFERRTRGWLAHLRCDTSEAAAWFMAAADAHRLAGHPLYEAGAWYELVLIGEPSAAVRPLTELAAGRDDWAPGPMAAHASALADRDVSALRRAATQLRELCRPTDAAVADDQAASLESKPVADDDAVDLAAEVEANLTPRETEVAQSALRGLTSRQIGSTLNLSTRTVDNHLHNVYRKLGISGRSELTVDLLAS